MAIARRLLHNHLQIYHPIKYSFESATYELAEVGRIRTRNENVGFPFPREYEFGHQKEIKQFQHMVQLPCYAVVCIMRAPT